ncbi:MAG TPA: zinc ABC transporter substrate-binding protein [Planctomycetota bacterium]|nr:zinc ABC transporter substrate-binding protein [Planctomycetota bacterium]
MTKEKCPTFRRVALSRCGRLVACALLFAFGASCERQADPGKEEGTGASTFTVYTSFYPTEYFAKRLAGAHANVVCPVPDDADPIFWKPSPEAIAEMQRADLIVLNGASFEKWAETVSLPEARVVDTARSFSDRLLRYEESVRHQHGPAGEHSHEGIDGHTWLDPLQAIEQARAIRDALIERLPNARADIERSWTALEADLRALDESFAALVPDGAEPPPLLASHPAYNYLVRRYGWNVHNLDLDPETVPDDATIAEIRHTLEDFRARALLWESEPVEEAARKIEDELGVESIVVSPCELLSDEERAEGKDYLSIQRENIERLRPVFAAR